MIQRSFGFRFVWFSIRWKCASCSFVKCVYSTVKIDWRSESTFKFKLRWLWMPDHPTTISFIHEFILCLWSATWIAKKDYYTPIRFYFLFATFFHSTHTHTRIRWEHGENKIIVTNVAECGDGASSPITTGSHRLKSSKMNISLSALRSLSSCSCLCVFISGQK